MLVQKLASSMQSSCSRDQLATRNEWSGCNLGQVPCPTSTSSTPPSAQRPIAPSTVLRKVFGTNIVDKVFLLI
jgi:hypothetical protein